VTEIDCRIATKSELTQLADLRWRLHVSDEPIEDRDAYEGFIAEFLQVHEAEWKSNEVTHWVAVDDARVVAVMSVVIVRKLPRPGNLHGRWGYLANSYALPEVRNAGVGGKLLAAIRGWAVGESLELLVVWPSEMAYPFYERAGFQRYPDPVVLRLAPPG
jgi:GNAT superfamily N-acetyltransferase